MIEVSHEDAFAEACKALGEAIVRERFLSAELQRLQADLDHLTD